VTTRPIFWRSSRVAVAALLILCVPGALAAQFQMPDPKQMSGIPRPVTDLPDGSISVRLIRGQLSNNITNHVVELRVGDRLLKANTDAAGRAQFDSVTAGATVRAVADVDGEHLESQEFAAPRQGGIRLMLVATDASKSAAGQTLTPVAGQIVIGSARFVIEPREDTIDLYYILDVTNGGARPVTTGEPFAFVMPAGSGHCSMLEGSSPIARVNGTRVTVQGPFPPGSTAVQVACGVAASDSSLTVEQRFPAGIERPAVIVKRVGATRLVSPQLTNQQELTSEGERYIAAVGPPIAAGQPISLWLQDLPRQSAVPRWIALVTAGAIVLAGAWASIRRPRGADGRGAERRRLLGERSRLLNELVRLEQDRRTGQGDDRRYTARREELLSALEQIYAALDRDGAGPEPFDRSGVAA
jgi:hypothetical protein